MQRLQQKLYVVRYTAAVHGTTEKAPEQFNLKMRRVAPVCIGLKAALV